MDSLHVIAGERKFDEVAVQFQLLKRVINPAECLLGLKSAGVVIFRNVDGEEESAFPALPGARQVPLSFVRAVAHAAPLIELEVQGVNVGVENQRALMNRLSARGNLGAGIAFRRRDGGAQKRVGRQQGGRQAGIAEKTAAV